MRFLFNHYDRVFNLFCEHIFLSFSSLLIGILIAFPLGIVCYKNKKVRNIIMVFVEFLYTIPGLALLSLLVPILGLGLKSSVLALILYSQMILINSVVTAFDSISPTIIEAAYGMGMNKRQIIFKVMLPIGFPIIIGGIKIAALTIISLASIASFINGGGLGELILEGIRSDNVSKILVGTVCLILIIFITNSIFYVFKHNKILVHPAEGEE